MAWCHVPGTDCPSAQAAEMLAEIRTWRASGASELPREWLTRGAALTMANAAVFDAANGYAGCLPGILEVLRCQGLVRGTWTFDTHEVLSPGQREAIGQVMALQRPAWRRRLRWSRR